MEAAIILIVGLLLAGGVAYMSAATDRLNASIQNLTTAVDTAVAKIQAIPATDDAAVNAAADQVDALTAKLNSATPAA